MTEQPTAAGPQIPAGKLQPLVFKPISDDGRAAIFEALVAGGEAPGSPVFALTVTVASSVPRESQEELGELLGQMKAAFELVPGLSPDDGGSGDEDSVDLSMQIRIEPRLASFDGSGPVGFAATVETTTGIVPAPVVDDPGSGTTTGPILYFTVKPRLDDYWYATTAIPPTAHVKIGNGAGTIRRPTDHRATNVFAPYTYQLQKAKEVIVHANNQTMTYTLTGNFWSPNHP